MSDRLNIIRKTSIVGILTNILLATFKIVLGTIIHSIAILLDGVNNLSDAGSSLITIIGAEFAKKPADKEHPFGHGRAEYLSALIISALVLYAGITSLVQSIKAIISHSHSDYSTISLVIISIAIFVKLFLAIYTLNQGKRSQSGSLIASGKDAFSDVAISTTTLLAALIYIFTNISTEAYLGIAISLLIIKTGIDLSKETISKLLGEPADIDLVLAIKKTVNTFPEVNGVYDLILNNYGPEEYTASLHIEVNENLTARKLDALSREIMEKVRELHNVKLVAVGLYSTNLSDEKISAIKNEVFNLATSCDYVKSIHGFYINPTEKKMRFDIVISLDSKNRTQTYYDTIAFIQSHYPDYNIQAGLDIDFNELVDI